jgi:two-component system response regulator FlrC
LTRVLVVDDDPAARRLYGAFLRSKGMEVREAESGIEAVQKVEEAAFEKETAFSLVVMDLDMPGIDGWMAMSLIRARLPHLPMVILTAHRGEDFQARANKLGVYEILYKPCPHDELLRAAERAVSGAHGR